MKMEYSLGIPMMPKRFLRFAIPAAVGFGLLAELAVGDTIYTYVPIPGSNDIQTNLISTFPTAIYTANNALGTSFDVAGTGTSTCGQPGTAACNFYDGFTQSGSTLTLNVSVVNATDVYTLLNAYDPAEGQELATIEFLGTGGTSLTYELIGGEDIRDFYQGAFANALTNNVPGVNALNAFSCVDPTNCLGGGGTGNVNTGDQGTYVVDEQDFSLGSTFDGQTLTQIVITDTYAGSTPILLGATVGTNVVTVTPEPSSLILIICALTTFVLLSRRRNILWQRASRAGRV